MEPREEEKGGSIRIHEGVYLADIPRLVCVCL